MPRLTIDEVPLHYELTGERRPAIVLIHGGCCSGSDWTQQATALAEDFAVLVPDLRGHGRSGGAERELTVPRWAADVNALIEVLDLAPAVIVGHSLGSRIAAEAVWQRPDQAAALVLLDGSRTVGGQAARAPRSDFAEAQNDHTSLEAIIGRTIGPHAAPVVRERIVRTMSGAPQSVLLGAAGALEEWDRDRADLVFAALPAGLPVLAIQSTYHDKFTPRRSFARSDETSPYLDSLRQSLPRLAVRVLPRTGHFSMMERPEEVTALIRDVARAVRQG